jgi:monoterpene epsilon-lactone hydrolase
MGQRQHRHVILHAARWLRRACGGAALALGLATAAALAQTAAPPQREVPAKSLPVPTTVSPQMQPIIVAPINPAWNFVGKSADDWKAFVKAGADAVIKGLPAKRDALRVKVEPTTIEGVKAYIVTPDTMPPEHNDKLLIHVHGGCYVSLIGEAATDEALFMAGLGRFKVIVVDYRTPPDFPYPAALDDAMTVWKAALKMAQPKNIAIFGSSAGGALTLEMVLRAKQEGVPLPGAIAPGTPMSDLTNAGDSFVTNAMVDNVLVAPNGGCDARAALYANGHDLKDPLLSPIFGDMRGFPPTILTTGTRDLLLSSTVRVHRKLRQAGVEAVLQVFEGQSHAQFYRDPSAPETQEAFSEITRFFDLHLGK